MLARVLGQRSQHLCGCRKAGGQPEPHRLPGPLLEHLTKRSPLKMEDVKFSESGQAAILEYMVKEYRGVQVNPGRLV